MCRYPRKVADHATERLRQLFGGANFSNNIHWVTENGRYNASNVGHTRNSLETTVPTIYGLEFVSCPMPE